MPLLKAFGSNLSGLNLAGCVLLGDEILMQIRQSCSKLRRLDLGELGRATAAGLLGLFLDTSCADANGEGKLDRDEGYDQAEEIIDNLLKRRKVAPADVECAEGIGPLERISLKNVRNVTDETLQYLTESCKGLEFINIGGCSNLTSKSAICIALNTKHLRELDVSFTRGILNDSMTFLANNCLKLRSLTVWGCTQLDTFFDAHDNRELLIVGRL